MKSKFQSWLTIGAALTMLPVGACAQENMAGQVVSIANAEAALAPRLAEYEARGASGFVAIARDGEISFLSFGKADAASGRGYTPDTQFDIGSVTKPLTGLVASQLMVEGVLDPQSTLADHFDNVPADKSNITVEQLLTHTAGFSGAHGHDLKPMDRDAMLADVFGTELLSEPGATYRYSNTGFSLVAAIIEQLTGEPFETVALRMFEGIGMNSTGYWAAYEEERADADPERGPVSQASWGGLRPVSWALTGNGGMVSSASDLLTLGQALLAGDLPEQVASAWKTKRVSEGMDGFYYGYGLAVRESPKLGEIYWHNGGNPAFRTEWWNIADSNTSIVVHLNDGDAMIDDVLVATLESLTGLDLGRSEGDDEALDFGPAPDNEKGRIAAHMVEAILVDDRARWEAFVRQAVHPQLVSEMPMDAHLQVFGQLREEVSGGTPAGYAETERGIWMAFDKGDVQVRVKVEFEDTGHGPRIVGVMSK
ncbi:serine hydrolase domain-containing protein [Sphingomicrobium clamense]|uniref:Beta-lactamase family protein n=1 Tax=Sphingomicrobium clamense TaxID=2851013 RepID=A0ABS6V290_9SPHN|nr:serine hydrolase domain-containing protein [Sphingomicrobium sp. B8]MBW0143683.1 beta-lactamase family protein [Sphingomicrobium sp. B8]